MFYLSIAVLGVATGLTLRWPGLLLVVSIVSAAFGIVAGSDRLPLPDTLARAALSLLMLNVTYLAGTVIRHALLPRVFSRRP